MRVITVVNQASGAVVGDKIEVADTSLTRFWGLLGRRGLNTGGGLWIKPSSGVHTLCMMFPIDVVGLDKDLKVIRLWKRIAPFRVTSVNMKIKSVVELPAGHIESSNIQLGDTLAIQ
jgi:uncharacterized membrane protein (UPF0127 family)